MLCTPKPNGFADHYPYEKWLFHWEYTLFSDKPIYIYIPSNHFLVPCFLLAVYVRKRAHISP